VDETSPFTQQGREVFGWVALDAATREVFLTWVTQRRSSLEGWLFVKNVLRRCKGGAPFVVGDAGVGYPWPLNRLGLDGQVTAGGVRNTVETWFGLLKERVGPFRRRWPTNASNDEVEAWVEGFAWLFNQDPSTHCYHDSGPPTPSPTAINDKRLDKANPMAARHVFTSESVTEGHPDKICDQVSDAVLDRILEQDPTARVACESVASTGMIFVTGEITTDAQFDVNQIARDTLEQIGYTNAAYGIDSETCSVVSAINEQSPDISQGVDGEDPGAGDQGLMLGYAVDETDQLMPAPILYAHRLARRLAEVRRSGELNYLRPDGKSQITLEYSGSEIEQANAIVLAAQHGEDVDLDKVREDLREHAAGEVVPDAWLTDDTDFYINHTGRFVRGGPFADAGLTGRKVIVDTYGGRVPHGGGAFSGKDPTKVDRSASYYARYAAKNVVAGGLADECQLQLAYSIASRQPVGVNVDTRGTGVVPDDRIADIVEKTFDFSPGNMIDELELREHSYQPVAAYGHFGRSADEAPWERVDRAEELESTVGDKADPPQFRGD